MFDSVGRKMYADLRERLRQAIGDTLIDHRDSLQESVQEEFGRRGANIAEEHVAAWLDEVVGDGVYAVATEVVEDLGAIVDHMLEGKKKAEETIPDPPGRTFNRVLTGRYFGCEDKNADEATIAEMKQEKIDQINELELLPKFIRYSYDDTKKRTSQKEEDHPISAHVAFQKEVFAENWNMIHVTEISFTIYYDDFEEFEKMAGVSLADDFRDLTTI